MHTIYGIIIFVFLNNYGTSPSAQAVEQPLKFEVEYQWTFINFTWESEEIYQDAIETKKYIPENNAVTGLKFYKDRLFIAMQRSRDGYPVTLGYISTKEDAPRENPLITPFPDWETNTLDGDDCSKLISVVSMEIDPDGVLWVIDGHRMRSIALCPPKLVLYDLNKGGRVIQTYIFPNDSSLTIGGFLNDIVVDVEDGGYAYISEHSNKDPGLLVYSRKNNRSWKLRDPSIFGEPEASHFHVGEMTSTSLSPIDGIALAPPNPSGPRYIYYSAVTGYSLYGIDTSIARDETMFTSGNWRYNVTYFGAKQAQSDGMIVDNEGNLYYGLLSLLGVGKWNINEDFETAEIIDQNNTTMVWTNAFAFDDQGYLYLLTNHILNYVNLNISLEITDEPIFRILKLYTGTNSYVY